LNEDLKRGNLIVESKELLALDLLKGLGVGWVSRGSSRDTERHDCRVLSLAQYSGRGMVTYDPGLGETEEFPNLSERVGVELEVVLFVSYVLLEDERKYLERSTHSLGGQGGPNNVLDHTGRSLDPGLECLIISIVQ
jgi:hypothetical protein